MNLKKYLIALTSLMVVISACQKENGGEEKGGEFKIDASLEHYAKANDTAFDEADVIGVFVTENGMELATAGNYDGNGDNLAYTYTQGKWVKSGDPLIWKDRNATAVYGYYPRNSSVGSITAYPFTVPGDQSDKEKYSSADFLWAKKADVAYGNSATLQFAHRMSNIEINITKDAGIGAITDVTIQNVLNVCSINLGTGAVTDAATGTPVMVLNKLKEGEKYRAILAPQTITNKDFIVIKATVDGVPVEYKYHVNSLTLASGTKYTYSVALKQNEIKVTIDSITEWTGKDDPAEEGEAEGDKIVVKPLITSSFIQSWDLIGFYDNLSLITSYLDKMREAGITEVVIDQAVYYSKFEQNPDEYLSIIPISKEELEKGVEPSGLKVNFGSKLEHILSYCETNNMKVFVGIYYDNRQWWKMTLDQTELTRCMKMSNNVMDKVLELYETKYPNALHGWYFSWEVNNVDMNAPGNDVVLKSMFTTILDHINSKPVRRPLLLSPFANESGAGAMSATQYAEMWKGVFNDCPFRTGDIFAPQDCIGTGKLSMINYNTWMGAYAQAVASRPGLVFGINVELFTPASVTEPFGNGRVTEQLQKAAAFSTKILSFSYFFHYCRGEMQNHTDYVNYKNGILI